MPQPPRLDHRNQDLRNRSFKNQDLTGADFSGSDIRGCNFSGVKLTGANFQHVNTDQSLKQFVIQFAIAAAYAVAIAIAAIGNYLGFGNYSTVAIASIAVAIAIALVTGAASGFVNLRPSVGVLIVCVFAIIFAVATAGSAIFAFGEGVVVEGVAWSGFSVLLFGVAIYIFKGFIRIIRNEPETEFKNADLASANFSQATIQDTDFSGATLNFVNWTDASFARCRFPDNFADPEVRQLCTSRDGHRQNYSDRNLKNLHLVGVTLTGANLAKANLSHANLQSANLEKANLSEVQALGTNFSKSLFTGACIQHWWINPDTDFTDVRCDYIYLRDYPDEPQRERKPASGSFQPGDFAKIIGKYTETLDLLFRQGDDPEAFNLAFRKLLEKHGEAGISINSFENLGDGDMLLRLLIADSAVDKAVLHQYFTQTNELMQKQLKAEKRKRKALEGRLYVTEKELSVTQAQLSERERVVQAWEKQVEFLQNLATDQKPQSSTVVHIKDSQFGGDAVSEGNKIRIDAIQGDASGITGGDNSGVAGKDITGAAGGSISGTLTLTIGQLEATKDPNALKLADLLKQLKAAIEKTDSGLDAKDKEKALKHVDAIGKLGNDPKNADLLEKAGDALDALPTIIKRGNGLMEFAEKYLPTITAGIKTVLAAGGIAL